MPSKELEPTVPLYPQPEELAQLTAEQQMLLVQQGLINPTAIEGNLPPSAQVENAAVKQYVASETLALNNANHSTVANTIPGYFAAEAAQQDEHVQKARQQLDEIFGSRAVQVTEAASVQAIDESSVSTANSRPIAEAIAVGKSPVMLLKHEAQHSPESLEPFAALTDRVNGEAARVVNTIAVRSQAELKGYGIEGVPINSLADTSLINNGEALTKTDVADAAINQAVGAQLIHSILDNNPRMTKKLREELSTLIKKPGGRAILRAVAGSRSHTPSAATQGIVGKNFRQSQHLDKAA